MKAWLLVSAVLIIGSALANLDGVTVRAQLDAGTGGFMQQVAAVGPGVEFTGTVTSGIATIALDIADTTVSLTLVNRAMGNELNPDGLINVDWKGLKLSGLTDPVGPITKVVLIESTFPPGTFDRMQVTRDSIEWELHAVRMPGKDTTWHAVWQVGVGNR